MLQSKLLTLLRCFNDEEIDRFGVFLQSPYFNQSNKLCRFFDRIKTYYPLFDSNKLEKEKIYKVLHPGSVYNDATMRELISDLFKLAKTFLAHQQLSADGLQASALRFKWLFAHNIEKLADAELQTHRTLLDELPAHNDQYYYHQWQQNMHRFEITSQRVQGSEHKLLEDFDIFAHVHALNRNYLFDSFTLYAYLLALTRIYKFSLQPELLNALENLARSYVGKGHTAIDLQYNTFQLTRTDDEKYFFELKDGFFQNNPSVPADVQAGAGIALENYCAKKIREGDERYGAEAMQVYRFEVENKLHLSNDKISYIYYFNVAVRGAETGEFAWTENFVENHKKYLPDEFREDSYNYAKAYVLFTLKKFKESLRLALSCNVPFFVVKILIRNLVARAQYELGMMDELMIELDTHRHHLKDEKLTPDRRQHLQTFITIMRQLSELKGNYNHEKLLALSAQVEQQKGFANRNWFREKIRELAIAAGKSIE